MLINKTNIHQDEMKMDVSYFMLQFALEKWKKKKKQIRVVAIKDLNTIKCDTIDTCKINFL